MNLPLADAPRGHVFTAFVQRRWVVAQPTPPVLEDWPDEAVDACAPEGASLAFIDGPGPVAARLWS